MISVAAFSTVRSEIGAIKKSWETGIAMKSNDELRFCGFTDHKALLNYIESDIHVDILCYDINIDNGIEAITKIRADNRNIILVLIVSPKISPLSYMKPSIMAATLIIRPVNETQIQEAAFGILEEMGNVDEKSKGVLKIKRQDGILRIDYNDIFFFEAREKKIFVNTLSREYAFYDTLDSLAGKLPEDFVRCHKSYIVNKSAIVKVSLSRNEIELKEKRFVPLSRTYKKDFK